MAANAIARNASMIECRVAEIVRVMAIFAAIARLRVADRFADRFYTVMAGGTGFGYARVIEVRDRPFSGGVAAFAFGLRDNMVSGLSGRRYVVMAALAPFGSANKYATLVACVTCNFRMCSRQRKPRREMVEFFLGHSGRGKANGKTRRH
jgi:hypothetical protein